MLRPTLYISLFLVAILVGCGSFNNSFNSYPPTASSTTAAIDKNDRIENDDMALVTGSAAILPATPTLSQENAQCDPFKLMVFPVTPDLPYKDITKAGNDAVKLERIERKHIDDLRMHISKMRQQVNHAQFEYSAKCSKVEK